MPRVVHGLSWKSQEPQIHTIPQDLQPTAIHLRFV
jgi:hypothetical protein